MSPLVSEPTLWNYTVCGQYPGPVPASTTTALTTVSLHCQDNLPPFRYVIVQFPKTNDGMNVCEIEVLVLGMYRVRIDGKEQGSSPVGVPLYCLGGAVVRRRTRDRKVAGLPAGALSSQLGQLSLPSLWGR